MQGVDLTPLMSGIGVLWVGPHVGSEGTMEGGVQLWGSLRPSPEVREEFWKTVAGRSPLCSPGLGLSSWEPWG